MRKALFPGSFDPVTLGHQSIIKRATTLFDEIVIAIGENNTKKYRFSLEERIHFLKTAFKDIPKVSIISYSTLTINYCKENNIPFILRGIRNEIDFQYEQQIALANKKLAPEIETVLLPSLSDELAISSSIVKDILKHGGNVSSFIPKEIQALIHNNSSN